MRLSYPPAPSYYAASVASSATLAADASQDAPRNPAWRASRRCGGARRRHRRLFCCTAPGEAWLPRRPARGARRRLRRLRAAAAGKPSLALRRVKRRSSPKSAAMTRGVCSTCPSRRLDLTQSLIREYAIDCDYRANHVHVAVKPRHVQELDDWARELHEDYGYRSVTLLNRDELQEHVRSERYLGGLIDSRSGHLHPLKFTRGRGARRRGRRRRHLREFPGAALSRTAAKSRAHRARDRALRASGALWKCLHRRRRARAGAAHSGGGHLHHCNGTARRRAGPRTPAEQCRNRRHQLDPGLFQVLGRSPPAVRRARQLQRRAAAAPG